MAKSSTAESRLLKGNGKTKLNDTGRSNERPNKLALLAAVMNFVGGLGKMLDFFDRAYRWWLDIDL